MTLSIRLRLLLWTIGGMAALLALFAAVVYGVLYRSLLGGSVAASAAAGVFTIRLVLPAAD